MGGRLMQNLPHDIVIGRYHSLYVERDSMPAVLSVTASTEDGVAMAIEHNTLPVGGVQFHPVSLMSLGGEVGLRIVENAFRLGVPAITREDVFARSIATKQSILPGVSGLLRRLRSSRRRAEKRHR